MSNTESGTNFQKGRRGQQPRDEVRYNTEDVVEQVSGVEHLENRLRPKRQGGQIVNISNAQ